MEAVQELFRKDRRYPKIPVMEKSEDGRMVSEQDYWEHYYLGPNYSYGWNSVRLEECPVTDPESFRVYHWFF